MKRSACRMVLSICVALLFSSTVAQAKTVTLFDAQQVTGFNWYDNITFGNVGPNSLVKFTLDVQSFFTCISGDINLDCDIREQILYEVHATNPVLGVPPGCTLHGGECLGDNSGFLVGQQNHAGGITPYSGPSIALALLSMEYPTVAMYARGGGNAKLNATLRVTFADDLFITPIPSALLLLISGLGLLGLGRRFKRVSS